ncbi:hypothetical protein CMI37_36480 [Candidatus Pacearchaeota archaeon]|nr:hypothetical protein [Candidatus Pacearchaeota archaeon]|tara:strand:+ start:1799 stop:2089 length:291 start_codon:yes stop_codon:yes gene_type:complete
MRLNKQKTFFTLAIFSIFILLILTANQKPIMQGTVKEIKYTLNRIVITLTEHNQEIILFTPKILDLQQGQQIEIYGSQEKYKNKTQIIAHKIISYP